MYLFQFLILAVGAVVLTSMLSRLERSLRRTEVRAEPQRPPQRFLPRGR